VAHTRQFGSDFPRWVALVCLLLVIALSSLEAIHAHSDRSTTAGPPCLICLSAHAKTPASTVRLLPVLVRVEVLAAPSDAREDSLAARLELFSRPPPC